MGAVRQLRQKRDMSINEIKLTLAIEDPTTREKRDYLGIEVLLSHFCHLIKKFKLKVFLLKGICQASSGREEQILQDCLSSMSLRDPEMQSINQLYN